MLQIEERYQQCLSQSARWFVEQWSKVLCQVIVPKNSKLDLQQRENRNLYTVMLLDQILSKGEITEFFLQQPPPHVEELPVLPKEQVIMSLSERFRNATQNLDTSINDREYQEDNIRSGYSTLDVPQRQLPPEPVSKQRQSDDHFSRKRLSVDATRKPTSIRNEKMQLPVPAASVRSASGSKNARTLEKRPSQSSNSFKSLKE